MVVCEAYWPPSYGTNLWIEGISSDPIKDANDALKLLLIFSLLSSASYEVICICLSKILHRSPFNMASKVQWLIGWREKGFFGTDLYSLQQSREQVSKILRSLCKCFVVSLNDVCFFQIHRSSQNDTKKLSMFWKIHELLHEFYLWKSSY